MIVKYLSTDVATGDKFYTHKLQILFKVTVLKQVVNMIQLMACYYVIKYLGTSTTQLRKTTSTVIASSLAEVMQVQDYRWKYGDYVSSAKVHSYNMGSIAVTGEGDSTQLICNRDLRTHTFSWTCCSKCTDFII